MMVNKQLEQERVDLAAVMDAWAQEIGVGTRVTAREAVALCGRDLRQALKAGLRGRPTNSRTLTSYITVRSLQVVNGRAFNRELRSERATLFYLEQQRPDGPWNDWGY